MHVPKGRRGEVNPALSTILAGGMSLLSVDASGAGRMRAITA